MRWLLALGLVACSGPVGGSAGGVRGDGDAGGSEGGAGGPLAVSPAATVFSLSYPPLTATPGLEEVACVDLPGPQTDTWVSGWHVVTRALHHVNLWLRKSGTPYTKATVGCVIPTDAEQIFDSSVPDLTIELDRYIPGASLLLPAGSSLILDAHVLNTGASPESVSAQVDFREASGAVPVFYMGFGGGRQTLAVAPKTTQTVTYQCKAPRDVRVLEVAGHAHSHDVAVTWNVNGVEQYRSTSWASPPEHYFDGLFLKTGDQLSWSCQVANDLPTVIKWGISVSKSEMCVVHGYSTGAHWGCTAP